MPREACVFPLTAPVPNESSVLTSSEVAVPASTPKRVARPRWKIYFASGVLLLGTLAVLTQWPHYIGTSICQECGRRRDCFDWNSRFFTVTLHRFASESPTLVSRAFAPPEHRHRWTAPLPPVAADEEEVPSHLLYAVEDPRVARFAEELALYTNPGVLEKWRRIILDPRYSVVIGSSLHFLRFPDAGLVDAAASQRWWRSAEFPLWNRLRELTEPD